MATEVVLPQWGMNMTEGTITRWLKKEGEPVNKGEPFAEVETEKINTEFEAPASGVIAHVMVPEGETVPVGTLIVVIAEPGEEVPRPQVSRPAASRPPARPVARPVAPAAPPGSAPAAAPTGGGPNRQIVPAARRLAQEHGIDLNTVAGSGPGGRVLEEDVRRALEEQERPAPAGEPLAGMRRVIAERMLLSAQTMAQVSLHTEVDVTDLVQLRHDLLSQWRRHRIRPLDLDFFVKATARALKEHPALNGTLQDGYLAVADQVDVGIATALPSGLVVPVIRRASEKSLLEVAQEIRELSDKARRGALSAEDIDGGTFTITNLASYDIDAFTPLINPPQLAILGIGRMVEKPAVVNGAVAVRSMMTLSLTFDHRATDGAPAAEFLRTVARYLREPGWMATG